jgi:filamentous hemagglutinin
MAVYRSGLTVAYANDLIDGGGRVRSGVLETPTGVSKSLVLKAELDAVAGGTANTASGARLQMQLAAEQAAGTRPPTFITGYSDHAAKQIVGRDGGIGVSNIAVKEAFESPAIIQYAPSAWGPTFKYIGRDATVVLNAEGKVVTAWANNSNGTRK